MPDLPPPGADGALTVSRVNDVASLPAARPESVADGVEGNSRLTSLLGLVLLVLLAVEGLTIVDLSGLLTLHLVVGVLLVGPTLLKVASTVYRFVRYYGGSAPYVQRGAPPLILRLIGPLVIATSALLLLSGVGLVFVGHDPRLLFVHRASFIVWFGLMTIHVLGHLRDMSLTVIREVRSTTPQRLLRIAAVVISLAAGLLLVALVMPHAGEWLPAGVNHFGR